jgi:hypothetical protein
MKCASGQVDRNSGAQFYRANRLLTETALDGRAVAVTVTLLLILTGCITPVPKLAPPPGIYYCPETVTITDAQAGTAIFYTTDGSVPTASSAKYIGPFSVSKTDTIRAIAIGKGAKASHDVSVTYTCSQNAAIGLLRDHLFASPQAAHMHALELAKARQQILKLPTSTTWTMPTAYARAFHGKQPPPVPDPANVWFPIGPAPISFAAAQDQVWGALNAHETGRIISIAPSLIPQGPIYAGGEFGGVWVYSPSSGTWTPLTDNQVSPQIGTIAIDVANPQTIYAGTGANNSAAPCGSGVFAQGILKSTNGGASWTVEGATDLSGYGIGRILVGQGDVFAATSNGIYLSPDGGNTWSNTYSGCVFDMAFSAVSATTMYAATPNGIIQSTDTGMTWSSSGITQPALPAGFGSIYHIAIGVSRSRSLGSAPHQDIVYASVVGNGASYGCNMWAPYISPNGGQTWSTPGTPPSVMNGWCAIGYANSLAVDATDSNLAAFGGDWLYIYDAAQNSWTQVGIAVAHGDFRALAFDALQQLYIGNDGGVWTVPNPNSPYLNSGMGLNDGGLQVTEFYPGLGESQGGSVLIAGSQDNGTEIYQGSLMWNGVLGGDGAAAAIDQNSPMNMFAEALFPSQLLQSTVGGPDDSWSQQQPTQLQVPWNFALAISPPSPGLVPGPTALYIGPNEIYKFSTPSSGESAGWTTLTACPAQGTNGCSVQVAALRLDPLNPSHVFAGWSDGVKSTVNFSIDSGSTWSSATPNQEIEGVITAIATSPEDPYTIAITTQSGHVWIGSQINTASPAWTDDTVNLPVVQGIGLNAVIYASGGGLVIASDSGVFVQQSIGNSWAVLGQGLPNTKIEDLQWNAGDLIALTYGRGAWEVSNSNNGPQASISVSPSSINLGSPGSGSASATLTWSSQNTTGCSGSSTSGGGWSGNLATSGEQTVQTGVGVYVYTITCTGPTGNTTASATLTVRSVEP